MITEVRINEMLLEDFDFVKDLYPEFTFLGIFSEGKINYDNEISEEDFESIAIIIPNFKYFIIDEVKNRFRYISHLGRDITLIDLKEFYNNEYGKHIINAKYNFLNPTYASLYHLYFAAGDQTQILTGSIEMCRLVDKNGLTAPAQELNFTEKEKEGCRIIINTIGQDGYISINALVNSSGISRPVFNSLLVKLEKYNLAQIEKCGVKGTHIIFTEDVKNLQKSCEKLTFC